jgi:GNAT superfamily N-acetyltransferase
LTSLASGAILEDEMPIEIRPVSGYADLERWVATRNDVLPDDPDSPEMMALVRASELEHVDLLACENGEIVGTGMLAGDPSSVESSHPYVEVTVPAKHRGRGIGAALLRELSERARRLGKEGLECESRAHDEYSIAFLERRGFVETGRAAKYVLDLSTYEGPDPSQTEVVELAMLADRPDLLQGMYEVARVTYPEVGGYQAKQAESLHEWQLYHLGSPGTALDMTPIAIAEGQVIGFATLIRRGDGQTAEHRICAVLPGWRRRGIASMLLRAQLAAAKRDGLKTVIAWGRTAHAGETYGTKVGFEIEAETVAFRGPLQ